jgi:tRNA(Arg) A34 adenosine deaminase TadA
MNVHTAPLLSGNFVLEEDGTFTDAGGPDTLSLSACSPRSAWYAARGFRGVCYIVCKGLGPVKPFSSALPPFERSEGTVERSNMRFPSVAIQLPAWIEAFLSSAASDFRGDEERMRFVIALARRNVEAGTGGPFAAAVFDAEGRLIAPGVNLVISTACSVLHAEIVALVLAQKVLGRYDIGDGGRLRYDLFAAAEPCAMCFGAIPWAGVGRLVCGARDEDARGIGFDEGPKLPDWTDHLRARGIEVVRDVLRQDAIAVLRQYAAAGGVIYNPGKPAASRTP